VSAYGWIEECLCGIFKYGGENNGILIENTLEVWKFTL
jgi:hypothetical protein